MRSMARWATVGLHVIHPYSMVSMTFALSIRTLSLIVAVYWSYSDRPYRLRHRLASSRTHGVPRNFVDIRHDQSVVSCIDEYLYFKNLRSSNNDTDEGGSRRAAFRCTKVSVCVFPELIQACSSHTHSPLFISSSHSVLYDTYSAQLAVERHPFHTLSGAQAHAATNDWHCFPPTSWWNSAAAPHRSCGGTATVILLYENQSL